jgi:hypothetical protein
VSSQELQLHPGAPQFLFRDISEFFTPEVRLALKSRVAKGMTCDFDGLAFAFDGIQRKAFCVTTQTIQEHPRAQLHVAGPPCVSWSTMGKRLKTNGADVQYFIAWAGMRLSLQD